MRKSAPAARTNAHRRPATIVAALVAGAIALTLAAPAHAAGEAVNGRWIDLRFPAPSGAAACTSRTIELGFGTYTWDQIHQFAGSLGVIGSIHSEPNVPWRVYKWEDCIYDHGTGYFHTSTLTAPAANGAPSLFFAGTPEIFYHSASSALVRTWFGSRLWRN